MGMSRLTITSYLICLALSLSGCFNLATTGAEAVYNRQSIQKSLSDHSISLKVSRALDTEYFRHTNITVATYHGEVLLTGQVLTLQQKQRAEQIAQKVEDVVSVHNALTIAAPSSSLTRVSDAWLTTKIKSKLLASNDVDATQIKVITENGTVYLMGIIPSSEAEAAVELASQTDGVRRVIKVFSYIKIVRPA